MTAGGPLRTLRTGAGLVIFDAPPQCSLRWCFAELIDLAYQHMYRCNVLVATEAAECKGGSKRQSPLRIQLSAGEMILSL